MKIAYAGYGIDDLQKVKDLGFDTVLGGFTIEQMDQMITLGIGCIFNYDKVSHPAIIAYYLFDEPDLDKNNISLEEQEAKIAEFRAFTNLPLAIACVEEVERKCSLNFDWYMMDVYYLTRNGKALNYLIATIAPHILKHFYKGKKIFPIMGVFDDFEFLYFDKMKNFANYFRSVFRKTDDQAIFLWKHDGTTGHGIDQVPQYQEWAKELNNSTSKCWWITEQLLMGITWLFIKINPMLGKYKITI